MMKKFLLVCLIGALGTTTFSEDNFGLKIGGDVFGDLGSLNDFNKDGEPESSFEIGLEYLKPINKNLEFGGGISFQGRGDNEGKVLKKDSYFEGNTLIENTVEYKDFKGYDSVPVYLTGKYILTPEWEWKIYLRASLGYSINFGNDDIKKVEKEKRTTGEESNEIENVTTILSTDVDNGFFYSAGIGVDHNGFFFETLYQGNTADITIDNKKYDGDYNRLTMLIGVRF